MTQLFYHLFVEDIGLAKEKEELVGYKMWSYLES